MALNPELPKPVNAAILGTIVTFAGIMVLFSMIAIAAKIRRKRIARLPKAKQEEYLLDQELEPGQLKSI